MSYKGMIAVLAVFALALNAKANEWKTFQVKYKGKKNSIQIPIYKDGEKRPIRGVMQRVGGPLGRFAHRNQVAMIGRMDQGRGFSKDLLAAAAKATGRPELEFAGAIVQGISKLGRQAGYWAHSNRERAIAVILDHSYVMPGHPPRIEGVPMFFNSAYADRYQGHDRRYLHYLWCKTEYSKGQPCTSIIDSNPKHGHHGRGSTEQTATWLEEAMAHRVPKEIPIGKAYNLIDVDPTKCGGYVTLNIVWDSNRRSYHTNVSVMGEPPAPPKPEREVRSKYSKPKRKSKYKTSMWANRSKKKEQPKPKSKPEKPTSRWWMPGPKTAAIYVDWVKKNGGKVLKDEGRKIKPPQDAKSWN